MALISKLSRLQGGMQRHVDLSANELAVLDLQLNGTLLSAVGGAAKVGADDSLFVNGNISGSTVQAVLTSIDAALETAGAVEFLDSEFRVKDDVDPTKKMAFQLSGLTASTTRTLTLQDKSITVAGIADETFTGTTTVDKLAITGQYYTAIQSQTASADATINWNESNIQRITLDQASTTLVFSNGQDGAQYILLIDQDGTGGRAVTFPGTVDFLGPAPTIQQGAGERTVVSFFYDASKSGSEYQGLSSNDIVSMANGGTGANLSPVAGAVVYSDANSMELSAVGTSGQILQSNGSSAPSWLSLAGGDGISYSAGSFAVDLATDPGLEFSSAALRVKVDGSGAVLRGAAGLSVNVDNSSIEISANALQVKADGIDQTHIQLDNNTYLQALNASAVSTNVIGLNASNQIVFGSLPHDATVPSAATHLTNKAYVDAQVSAAAAGLDPKESVRVATTTVTGGTYAAGEITGLAALVIDGVTLAQDDRVLVKDQASALQNGIYIYDLANTKLVRSEDHNGTPTHEVSVGNFTFVENGTVNSGRGYVLLKDGANDGTLTLDTHNINWSLFSAAGSFTGGDGITITGNNIEVDLSAASGLEFNVGELQVDLASGGGLKLAGNEIAVEPADFAGQGLKDDGSDNLALDFNGLTVGTIAATDILAFGDADDTFNHKKVAFQDLLTGSAGSGLSSSGIALSVNVGDGIEIDSDAVALNINGIAGVATTLQGVDLIAIHDDSAGTNATITVANALGDGLDLTAGKIAVQLGNGLEFNTTADLKLAFDILSAETTIDVADVMAFHDTSAAGDTDHKKITFANILTQLAGAGLVVNAGSLDIQASEGITVDSDTVKLNITGLAAETSAADADELVFYDVSATAHKKITRANLIGDLSVIAETMVAGESFAANSVFAVRIAMNGETAGRVYKADLDATSLDKFYTVGLAVNTTGSAIAAAGSIRVVKLGALTLQTGALSAAATDIGKPVYLSASGALTLTAPTTANYAVVKVGMLKTHDGGGAHVVEVQQQVIGIN